MRNAYNVPSGKREGLRLVVRPVRRWEGNTRMDLGEIGWKVWTGYIWHRIGTSGGPL